MPSRAKCRVTNRRSHVFHQGERGCVHIGRRGPARFHRPEPHDVPYRRRHPGAPGRGRLHVPARGGGMAGASGRGVLHATQRLECGGVARGRPGRSERRGRDGCQRRHRPVPLPDHGHPLRFPLLPGQDERRGGGPGGLPAPGYRGGWRHDGLHLVRPPALARGARAGARRRTHREPSGRPQPRRRPHPQPRHPQSPASPSTWTAA